jgi:predicted transcriptional regulator
MKRGAIKRLPDAEFEVMKIIWRRTPPITTPQIIESLDAGKTWKPQTVLTMLLRLTEKGFLSSERAGRERCYTPLISEREYLEIETGDFLKRYSGNSIGGLLKAFSSGGDLTQKDLQELREWLAERT